MPGINDSERSSPERSESSVMARAIANLRRVCLHCADILVLDMQLGTRSLSLLVLENIV